MFTYISLLFIFVISFLAVCIITVIALNPSSKACNLNTKITVHGFKFSLRTNEKSTPSSHE